MSTDYYNFPEPAHMDGPYEWHKECRNCADFEASISYLKEDRSIAAQALAGVLKQLYTDCTFDKVALESAMRELCNMLDVRMPDDEINVTRKKFDYMDYATRLARERARQNVL